jgi:hypothetical protein
LGGVILLVHIRENGVTRINDKREENALGA